MPDLRVYTCLTSDLVWMDNFENDTKCQTKKVADKKMLHKNPAFIGVSVKVQRRPLNSRWNLFRECF